MRDPARPFGFWTATALVVGGMIGSGIFLVPSALASFGWTGVAAWIVGFIAQGFDYASHYRRFQHRIPAGKHSAAVR